MLLKTPRSLAGHDVTVNDGLLAEPPLPSLALITIITLERLPSEILQLYVYL